jgi:hypothetical protein
MMRLRIIYETSLRLVQRAGDILIMGRDENPPRADHVRAESLLDEKDIVQPE